MPIILGSDPEITGTGEVITLDPAEVATDRVAIEITPWISEEGIDWGDAAIEAYMADSERGSIPVDYRVPNRTVTIPLKLTSRGGVSFETIRRNLQAKAGLFQREGGWLSRVTAAGTFYADVVNATLRLGGDWMQANRSIDTNAQLSLELVPDWYGTEITLDDKAETSAAELVTVLKQNATDAVIAGDYPGRVRIVVDDDDGELQRGLIWGFRSQYYDSATTAALAYEAESLTPQHTAIATTFTGASGGTVVQHGTLTTDWTPVLSTRMLAGTADLTHRGSYRIWARCYSTSSTPPRVRLLYDVGDLVLPSENTPARIPGPSAFYMVNLGEIRIDPAPIGTHKWIGQIQAAGDDGGENISIDKLWIVPVDDGYGILASEDASPDLGLGVHNARDGFTGTTSGNNLHGRTPEFGAAWETSGAATDFQFIDAGAAGGNPDEAISRSVTSSSLRFGVLGSVLTDIEVRCRFGVEDIPSIVAPVSGPIARFVDASNYLILDFGVTRFSTPLVYILPSIRTVVAGTPTTIATGPHVGFDPDSYVDVALAVYANGDVVARIYTASGVLTSTLTANDSALATGGSLDDGKGGLADSGDGTNVVERWYDNIVVATPGQAAAVIYPNRSAQLRTDGMIRSDTAGSAYGPVSSVIGALPRIPPSGIENRKIELFLKASRGDLNQIPDSGIDDISARVYYRPSWLITPGS
jgi:hypothetical protein